jgi:SAM-dependent methyltransferase
VPDPIFADPRLAELYDIVDDDRRDLDAYVAIAAELGASAVLDVGCGTGTLACRLALGGREVSGREVGGRTVSGRKVGGREVVGLDPAEASLDVARRKAGAERVRWEYGTAMDLPRLGIGVDLAVMTGNVAQVFIADDDWTDTLASVHRALRPGGWLVFETRDPSRRAWETWTREQTYRELSVPGVGRVDTWTELVDVDEPLVSFRHCFRFHRDGAELDSGSVLRFRGRDELTECLARTGFDVRDVRDAPDRPGLEFVFVAQRA